MSVIMQKFKEKKCIYINQTVSEINLGVLASNEITTYNQLRRRARYLTGENLKVVWDEFSTLS
jgi:hypothetical protein